MQIALVLQQMSVIALVLLYPNVSALSHVVFLTRVTFPAMSIHKLGSVDLELRQLLGSL